MYFSYIYRTTGLRMMHSTDLDDMRRALSGEDRNGPDGDGPHNKKLNPERGGLTCVDAS